VAASLSLFRLGFFFDVLRQSEFWTRAPGFTFGKWGFNHGKLGDLSGENYGNSPWKFRRFKWGKIWRVLTRRNAEIKRAK